MICARVTQLESFRRFITDMPGTCENDLIESLTGKFKGNNKTEIGTQFHSLIETGKQTNENVIFSEKQKQMAFDHSINISPYFSEIRTGKMYLDKIYISGCTDVMQGNILRDTKTKFRSLSEIEYFNSYQWRFYLDIFGLNRFIYDVFEFVGYDDIMGLNVSELSLIRHEPFEFNAYEGMRKDIDSLVSDFIQFIEFKNLTNYFYVRN